MKTLLPALVFLYSIFFTGCKKENNPEEKAEGYVYEESSGKPVSDVPIVLAECRHNGTRCIYTYIKTTYTDAAGHYMISGAAANGSLSITVGPNDKTFGTGEFTIVNRSLKQDFFVTIAHYASARFIVQTQGRNFALPAVKSGYYSAAQAVFRNPLAVTDTTLSLKYAANAQVTLALLLRNETAGSAPYSDTLSYTKNIGFPAGDTSVVWSVP